MHRSPNAVELTGRVDRLDLCKAADGSPAWFTILDYKSSEKKMDAVLLRNGIQIQLPAYLAALRDASAAAAARWSVPQLTPAGAFYINLRGKYQSAGNCEEASEAPLEQHKTAARHRGLFDLSALEKLDKNAISSPSGQFKAQFTKEGKPWTGQCDGRPPEEFQQTLDRVTQLIKDFGLRILDGDASVAPYSKGGKTACEFCDAKSICRSDPWTRQYRMIE